LISQSTDGEVALSEDAVRDIGVEGEAGAKEEEGRVILGEVLDLVPWKRLAGKGTGKRCRCRCRFRFRGI